MKTVPPEILNAINALTPKQAESLMDHLAGIAARGYAKLPHVSIYQVRGRFRVSYRVPGHPRRTERLGRDGRAAYKWARFVSETLEQVKSRLMRAEQAFQLLYVDRQPIEEHVAGFESSLKTKGVVKDHLTNTMFRIRECIAVGNITRIDQVTPAKVESILEKLLAKTDENGEKILTDRTVDRYLRVLKQFMRWCKGTGKISNNLIEQSSGVKASAEDSRRDILPDELVAIYAQAMSDTKKHYKVMPGPDRAILYLTAFCTGFRRKECRSAEVSWLKLDANPPHVLLPPEFAKNRKRAEQPIPAWLASVLCSWLGDRRSGKLFPNMPKAIVRAFDRDREAARKAWINEKDLDPKERENREASDFLKKDTADGKLVFHSARHGFASTLLASGAEPKLVQSLTRHSTISLLFDRYGHTRLNRAASAVEHAMPQVKEGVEKAQRDAQRSSASVTVKDSQR